MRPSRWASSCNSKLDRAAFRARGFTSPKVRHLLNNLGSLEGLDYLEVGVHRGATFVATNYKNALASATAIDNWSEFAESGTVKDEFLRTARRCSRPSRTGSSSRTASP